tara:strand:+ start:1936 stop:3051 length:1116 start_codon:yes stop_codon:yes gene_type:complete
MEYFLIVSIFFCFSLAHSYSIIDPIKIDSIKDENYIYIYYIFVFMISLAIGLRGDNEYTRFYNYAVTLGNYFSIENYSAVTQGPVFSLIMSSLKSLNMNSQALVLLFAFMSIFLHAVYFQKFTRYFFLAFLIYLSHEIIFKEFATIRAGFASALVLPIVYYICNKDKIKYWSLIFLGGLVQYVGFLSIFLVYLNRYFKPKLLVSILIIAVVTYFLDLSTISLNWLADIGLLPPLIANYLTYDVYVYDAGLGNFKLVQQTLTVSFLIFIDSKTNIRKVLPFYNLLFNAYFLSTILMIIFAPLALFAFRFGGHFYSVEPILITYLLYNFSANRQLSIFACLGGLSLAFLNYVILQKLENYTFLVDDYRIFLGY